MLTFFDGVLVFDLYIQMVNLSQRPHLCVCVHLCTIECVSATHLQVPFLVSFKITFIYTNICFYIFTSSSLFVSPSSLSLRTFTLLSFALDCEVFLLLD